jgi:hypothetical protein
MPSIGPLTDRQQQIEACIYWGTTIIDYDASSDIEYLSLHHEHNAVGTWTDWVIKKFTMGADGVALIEILTGAYDSRATLDWA